MATENDFNTKKSLNFKHKNTKQKSIINGARRVSLTDPGSCFSFFMFFVIEKTNILLLRSCSVCEEGWWWCCSLHFRPWWGPYYCGGSLCEDPILPLRPKLSEFCFLETEDRMLGRGKRSSTSWMDQIRAGLSRAGECSRLRPEVCEGIQQGFPDGSPGIHHEAPPVWGKTQEIIQVRVEFTSISISGYAPQLIFDNIKWWRSVLVLVVVGIPPTLTFLNCLQVVWFS